MLQCISTPAYSILTNGSPKGFFTAKRGLRLGDPLSSYLFILSMEILLGKLYKAESLSLIKGIQISINNNTLNHLLFADDIMIIVRATKSNARICRHVLDIFSEVSGQEVNFNESGLFFLNRVRGVTKRK